MGRTDDPTPKQLRTLADLANSRGTTFTQPTSRADASNQISRLIKRRRHR